MLEEKYELKIHEEGLYFCGEVVDNMIQFTILLKLNNTIKKES